MSACENPQCAEIRAILDRLLAEGYAPAAQFPAGSEPRPCQPWMYRWRERPMSRRR